MHKRSSRKLANTEEPPRRAGRSKEEIAGFRRLDVPVVEHGSAGRIEGRSPVSGKWLPPGLVETDIMVRLLLEWLDTSAVVLLDADGLVRSWNESPARLTGYRAEEVIGRHISLFYTPEEIRENKPTLVLQDALREGRVEVEGWRIRKDGSRFLARTVTTALRDDTGALYGFGKVGMDVTELKKAEESTVQNEELLQLLVRRVRDYAILVLDTEGLVVTWNEGAEQIIGYRPEEIIGQHFSKFYPPEDMAQGKPQRQLEVANRLGRFEDQGWRIRKDGTLFLANVNITALRDSSGKLRGYCKITRDISERREAEKRLVELAEGLRRSEESELARIEQLRMKDEFLSHVSHELRSPLASIHSFASIVADGLAGVTNPKQDEYLGIIMKNVKQLQAMIEDLLEVTHAQSGGLILEARYTHCSEAVDYTVEAMKGAAGAREIELLYDYPDQLPAVYADPMRLRQVLTILVDNAIKFTSPGGHVTVRISDYETDRNFQLVEVEDTGYGMSPQDTERIFDRLYQVPKRHRHGRRGLGLGLYIARELVLRMGGQIWVTSEPGIGSRFYFTVPVFSLEVLLGSVLEIVPKKGHALLLFCIFIHSPHEISEEAVREGRRLLKESLRPETDVLLPGFGLQGSCDILFLVCFSRIDSVDVLSERILASLARCEEIREQGAELTISHDVLTWADGAEPSGKSRKARICTKIQQCIDEACVKGRGLK